MEAFHAICIILTINIATKAEDLRLTYSYIIELRIYYITQLSACYKKCSI